MNKYNIVFFLLFLGIQFNGIAQKQKYLYLTDPSQGLDRIDPVDAGTTDNTNSSSAAMVAIATMSDDLNSGNYTGGTYSGPSNWSTDWIEVGDVDGPGPLSGDFQIVGGELRIYPDVIGANIYREMDLSSATTATLTYDMVWETLSAVDVVTVFGSNDGGATYVMLKEYDHLFGNTVTTESIDLITALGTVSANTRFKFEATASANPTNSYINFDNFSIDYAATGNTTESFTQGTPMCSPFTFEASEPVIVTAYATVTAGTMPASPDVDALLKYGATTILDLSGVTPTWDGSKFTWTLNMPSSVTVPTGQAISLDITTNESVVAFTVDYDSATSPSSIQIPTETYINVDALAVYDAAYSAGSIVTNDNISTTVYIRSTVSDPFGFDDITGMDIDITDPASGLMTVSATSVATSGCTRTYEYAWTIPASPHGTYGIIATANEGTEGVTHSDTIGFTGYTLTEVNCTDGLDDDGDGLVDCEDPDCGGGNIVNGCITVNSNGDGTDVNPGDGICADSNCECTLRAAIEEANALAGHDTICFNISGVGPFTIQPLTGLPYIIDQVTIDGYTQTGAVEATAGTPATLQIVLSGDLLTAGYNGLAVNHSDANKSIIKGLVINNFNFSNTVSGIIILWGDSIRIEGNHIGTNAEGTTAAPNRHGVKFFNFGTNSFVGGPLPAQRNVISGNSSHGIFAVNFAGNGTSRIENNYLGTNAAGTGAVANSNHGIHINSNEAEIIDNIISGNLRFGIDINGTYAPGPTTYVTIQGNKIGLDKNGSALGNKWSGINTQGPVYNILIGGISAGDPNIIANNGSQGIVVKGDSISIVSNSIYNNGGLGIDLGVAGGDGVTANDANDSDVGPNNYLNFIEFNQVSLNVSDIDYDFNADLPAGNYRVEIFNDPSGADPSGNGEGEVYIGSVQINHGGTGSVNFTGTVTPLSTVNIGDDLSAVTIECQDGSCTSFWATSEFSSNASVIIAAEICGNLVDDDGDGLVDCEDPDCNGSLICTDNDNDGISDAIDLDDDNDGILDADEFIVVVTNFQPPCVPLTLDFTGPAVLTSGTDLLVGAVYKYSSVSPGIDAKVTIAKQLKQSSPTIDDNSSDPSLFKPKSAFTLNEVGDRSYTEYLFEFVSGVGETPVIIPELFINFNDIDGSPDHGEENWVQLPTSYTEDDPTGLTTSINDWVMGTSGTTEYVGASNINPQVNFSARYINRSWLRIRVGAENRISGTTSSTRAHSIEFACVSNFLNPTTYLMDFDEDGQPNFLDLDSDNDGIYDCVESSSNQAQTGGVLNGGIDIYGIPLSVSDGTGGVNYVYGDADSDSTLNAFSGDSDGDSCNDVIEAGFPDVDGDGQLGGLVPPTVDNDGRVTSGGL